MQKRLRQALHRHGIRPAAGGFAERVELSPARPPTSRLDDAENLEKDHDHDDQDDQATDAVSVIHDFLLRVADFHPEALR